MRLTRDDILKLAKLSHLQLSESEVDKFQHELSGILDYVAQLDAVDTSGLEPTYQVTGLTSQDSNAVREDIVQDQVEQKSLMKGVAEAEDGQIRVKRMIG